MDEKAFRKLSTSWKKADAKHIEINQKVSDFVALDSVDGQMQFSESVGLKARDEEIQECMRALEQAWAEGRSAFHAGTSEAANPYGSDTKEFEFWLDGYEDGRDDIDQSNGR